MKRASVSLLFLTVMVFATMTVRAVGVPIDELTVPIESVTVSESSLRPLSTEVIADRALNAESESDRLLAVGRLSDQQTLVKVIRRDSSSAVRMAAFQRLVDGDLIFRMIFKPGEKAVDDVRLAAITTVAEVEAVKVIAEKSKDANAGKTAEGRLESVYAESSDRKLGSVHPSVRAAAVRTAGL